MQLVPVVHALAPAALLLLPPGNAEAEVLLQRFLAEGQVVGQEDGAPRREVPDEGVQRRSLQPRGPPQAPKGEPRPKKRFVALGAELGGAETETREEHTEKHTHVCRRKVETEVCRGRWKVEDSIKKTERRAWL